MSAIVALTSSLLALTPLADAPREDFSLRNGIRATIVHVESARRETILTFVPLGLLGDDAGKAQFSHALEHLLIRSTDPSGLSADGFILNGETTSLALRLETMAEPARWRDALSRHARWIAARKFDPAVLEREKANIDAEEKSTAANGYTHKWAMAAWNQVARHGQPNAAVHGDVAGARAEDLERYAEQHLRVGSEILAVAIGPVAPKEVRAALESELGALPASPPPKAAAGARPDAAKLRAPGERTATWDLASRHYVEWYAMPDGGAGDRAAALVLSLLLQQRLQADAGLRSLGAVALAGADLVVPEGRFLYVSASLRPDTDVAKVRASIRQSLDRLVEPRSAPNDLEVTLRQVTEETSKLPDFAAIGKARSGQPGAELIEASMMLGILNLEATVGARGEDFAAAFAGLGAEGVMKIAREALDAKRRSSLLLGPLEQR